MINTKENLIGINRESGMDKKDENIVALEKRLAEMEKHQAGLVAENVLLRQLYERAPLGYQSLDENGCFLTVNQAWVDALGYSREEVIGFNFGDFLHSDWKTHFKDNFPRFKAIGEILGVEFEMVKKDGTLILVSIHGKIGKNLQGDFQQTHCIFQDITELRRVQEEYKLFFDLVPDMVCIASTDGYLKKVNGAWQAVLGFSEEELLAVPFLDFLHPDDKKNTLAQINRQLAGESTIRFSNRYRHKNGSYLWFEWHATPAVANLLFAVARDVTEKKKNEEALRELKELNEYIVQTMNEGVVLTDSTGIVTFINPELAALLGYGPKELVGRLWLDFVPPDQQAIGRAADERRKNLQADRYEIVLQRKDGERLPVLVGGTPRLDARGQLDGTLGVFTDITGRKQVEEALRESEQNFKTLSDTGMALIWTSGIDKLCNYFNKIWLEFTGRTLEQEKGKSWGEGVHPDDMQGCLDIYVGAFDRQEEFSMVYRLRRHDGEYRWLLDKGCPRYNSQGAFVGYIGHCLDVTELKLAEAEREKLQVQLIQAQKMESVGRLAGGVAHDFNNMLGVILGYSEMTLENVEENNPIHLPLQGIHQAALRSAELTRQLLAFARKQTIAPKVLDLNKTIEGMLAMLRRLIGENIDLAWLPGKNLGQSKLDPSQIDQILANLCVNASDAIPDNGKIVIETSSIIIDDGFNTAGYEECNPGKYILLSVTDTGCGMNSEETSHIFEPFYTTKTNNEGTGLGLATVYGIVRQNNGFVNVYSEPGCGTTFKIYLPEYLPAPDYNSRGETLQKVTPPGSETILLVEDEAMILQMTTRMLERLGYQVLPASSPNEAITLAQEYPGEIQLLLTDVVMPGMNGRDLAANLVSLHPGLKRLFMSGYTANVIAHHGVLEEGVDFIQKPFSREDLAVKVREVLGGG
ncbi:MAG TPA: hypothetical protein DDY32_19290 [Desulfobulbaceae bacterium]|nr:hypothetical protein [Desulfobulbaceae bacterium]